MKRCSTLNVAEEMQIKAALSYYCTLIKMSIETLRIPNAAEERYGATGTFIYRLWECSLGTQLSVSYKAKCILTV